MIAGSAGLVLGGTGIMTHINATDISRNLPPSLSEQLLSTTRYELLVIPGALLTAGAALYCFKSARGFFSKIRSTLGSSLTVAGGLLLATGCMLYLGADAQRGLGGIASVKDAIWYTAHDCKTPSLHDINTAAAGAAAATASGVVLSLLGYAIQPVDKTKKI
jgi:hypothetical protein